MMYNYDNFDDLNFYLTVGLRVETQHVPELYVLFYSYNLKKEIVGFVGKFLQFGKSNSYRKILSVNYQTLFEKVVRNYV